MQIIRLLQTVLILLSRKQVRAKELAERFEVSVRTIYRDVDALSLAGIPVYSVKGRNGGIFLDKDFSVNNTLIDTEEQQDLFLALNLLESVGFVNTQGLFEKLGALYDWSNWIDIDLSHSQDFSPADFQLFKVAIFESRKTTFTYFTTYGQTRLICLLPTRIIYKNLTWYILGYNTEEKKWLTYPFKRIKQVEIGEKSEANPLSEVISFERISVRLLFSKRIAYKKYDELAHLAITTNEDSSYEATMAFQDFNELYSFLLPLGNNVKIVSPGWVKDKVLAHVKSFYENHL